MKVLTLETAQLHNSVVALGKFQGLHRGHLLLINKIIDVAKMDGLNSVVFTININNSKMINTRVDRDGILRQLGVAVHVDCDFTPEFASMSPFDFVKKVLHEKLDAKYVVVGSDFCFGNNRAGNVNTLLELQHEFGYKVIPIEKLSLDDKIVSSSLIREMIKQGEMESVTAFMGRNYFIQGKVTRGRRLGRTIDFPTINHIPDNDKLLPPYGAYETRINIDGIYYKGITNIGDNPTISESNNVTVETHIIDFDGDLYDRFIKVEFVRFIREQKRFKDVNELREQLLKDKAGVMHQ